MTTINVDHDAFITTLVDLRRIAEELQEHRREVERSVDLLLDGGWSGRAADGYAAGWSEWREGCGRVLEALGTMTDLMASVRLDLAEHDDDVAARISALRGLLGSTPEATR